MHGLHSLHGQALVLKREPTNDLDIHAIAVYVDNEIVGHHQGFSSNLKGVRISKKGSEQRLHRSLRRQGH